MAQQFAIAAVGPRSIAWLLPPDDWMHFESVVAYNCAVLGGYFNALIPLTHEGTISAEYERFLTAYDPDLIVLAPDMHPNALAPVLKRSQRLNPFGLVPWDAVHLVATHDPRNSAPHMNAPVSMDVPAAFTDTLRSVTIAVAENAFRDTSYLALAACGDLIPSVMEPLEHRIGPREAFLGSAIGGTMSGGVYGAFMHGIISLQHVEGDVSPYVDEATGELRASPSREHLAHLVAPEYRFPLTGASDILEACLGLQLPYRRLDSFVGRTAFYSAEAHADELWTYWAATQPSRPPGVLVLVSQRFGIEEAALFWNMRACQTFVAWLPLAELQRDTAAVSDWLASGDGGSLYAHLNATAIAFAGPQAEQAQLQSTYNAIAASLEARLPAGRLFSGGCLTFNQLVTTYGASNRPTVAYKQVLVATNGATCSFLPELPTSSPGAYAITLRWDDLMLPRSQALVHRIVAPNHAIVNKSNAGGKATSFSMSRFRTTESRYLRAQLSTAEAQDLTFHKPTPTQVVDAVFTENTPYTQVKPSSVGSYHAHFIDRAGGLEQAVYYLTTAPYSTLLFTLADNTTPPQQKGGWLLERPACRRAVHHLDLYRVMEMPVPDQTAEYYRSTAGVLPPQVVELLEKGLLERGFVLACSSCNYRSWYPAEQVGQQFRCACCYQTRVYPENPPWLYKLPEVVFLGFAQNLHVPLLTLNHMKQQSRHSFSMVLDSDVFWGQQGLEHHGNVDIICMMDGHLYIGEAKSNDEIEAKQIEFYERLMTTIPIDGLIFATTETQWRPNTAPQIGALRLRWGVKIIELTRTQLTGSAWRAAQRLQTMHR